MNASFFIVFKKLGCHKNHSHLLTEQYKQLEKRVRERSWNLREEKEVTRSHGLRCPAEFAEADERRDGVPGGAAAF